MRSAFPGWRPSGRNGIPAAFVGALTVEFSTKADDQHASWIVAGTAPIYFVFGSMPVESGADTLGSMPVESGADTLAMIGAACAELRQRALVWRA